MWKNETTVTTKNTSHISLASMDYVGSYKMNLSKYSA